MMVLSKRDREEIAAMFQAFSEKPIPPRTPEDAFMQAAIEFATPYVATGAQRFSAGRHPILDTPRFVPYPERIVGEAIETALVPTKRKKAMTKFNKAVKEGMKIVRKSASYGKKGTITNSKKAFSAVTKAVSKARKGAKLPKKGVLRSVQSKAKGILGKVLSGRTPIAQRGGQRGRPAIFKPSSYYLGKKRGKG